MPRCVYYTYQGETLSMTAWARRKGWDQKTLWFRLVKLGWPIEKALETPLEDHIVKPGVMLWCSTHEVAWCREPVVEKESFWHPMTRFMIAYALAYAKTYGCEKQIIIREAACDRCQ